MNELNIFFLLITSPSDAIFLGLYKKRIAFFIFIFSIISISVGFSLMSPCFSFKNNLILNLGSFLFWLFISSAILHLSCEIIGGRGDCKKLFLSLSISLFPLIFIPALALLSKVYNPFVLGVIFCFLWVFSLELLFVKKLYSLSMLKTFLAFILPLLFFFFLLSFISLGFIEEIIMDKMPEAGLYFLK